MKIASCTIKIVENEDGYCSSSIKVNDKDLACLLADEFGFGAEILRASAPEQTLAGRYSVTIVKI